MTKVKVRAFEMADWEDVAEIFLAPSCQWGTLQLPYQSRDRIKQKLENPPPGIHRLVAVSEENQKSIVVGLISLQALSDRRSHVGQIGIFVHDDYQNQGIGSQLIAAIIDLAENWLSLKRLELQVNTDNPAAIHLYEKFGFEKEGILRKNAFRDGTYIDAYTMAKVS